MSRHEERDVSLYEALKSGEAYLEKCGVADARIDAWLLMEYVTGISRALFLAERGREMSRDDREVYQELLQKRGSHVPLQYLTGEQEFMGLAFRVNEHVLIPRQDTEILVEEAMKYLLPGMHILDLCTGSGCIAVSLAKLGPGKLRVDAADISGDALAVAAENARSLKAEVTFFQSDLFGKITDSYDMIVSNPPYIRTEVIERLSEEVRLHEPYQALDGKEDGLYFYRKIVNDSRAFLKKGGYLLFEIGYDQGNEVKKILADAGYGEIKIVKDLAGLDRVVTGRRQFEEEIHV